MHTIVASFVSPVLNSVFKQTDQRLDLLVTVNEWTNETHAIVGEILHLGGLDLSIQQIMAYSPRNIMPSPMRAET